MTENSRKVFEYLKANSDKDLTAQFVAQEVGVSIQAVTGSVNGLVKKGLARRDVEVEVIDGKEKEIKYIKLEPAAFEFDPDAK